MAPEMIRMPRKRYRELERMAEKIREKVNEGRSKVADVFTEADNYPTVETLKAHRVSEHLREFLPYLVFYYNPKSFDSNDAEFKRTKDYIAQLFNEYLDIIDDEEFDRFCGILPGEWKKMSLEEKVEEFSDWISYYNMEEFDSFLKDLGYLKFMGAYKFTEAAYKAGEQCPKLIWDMKDVWDAAQKELWGQAPVTGSTGPYGL